MKPFAKTFYNSPAWQSCRAAYISRRRQIDGGMCEGCGKSSYIRQHMDPTDLVVDLDLIRQALTMGRRESAANNLVSLTIAVREGLYKLIEARDERVDCKTVWIAATLPRRGEREELARRLKAELVFVGQPFEICLEQVMADPERTDKLLQREIIERWFEQYEP